MSAPLASPSVWSSAASAVFATVGVVLLIVLGGAWGLGGAYLDFVDPSSTWPGLRHVDHRPAEVVGHALLVALAVLLCAGLPRRSELRGAGQITGGFLLPAAMVVAQVIISSLFFFGEDEECVVDGCWVLPVQSAGIAAPAVLTGAVLVLVGLKAHRLTPVVRLLLPPGVWLLATAVQHLVWTSTMLPFLTGALPS